MRHNLAIASLAILAALLALASPASAYFEGIGAWAGKCAQSGGLAPGCGQIPEHRGGLTPAEQQVLQQQYQTQQAELDRLEQQREEDESRARAAAAADHEGVEAGSSGDWARAANLFLLALNYEAGDQTIRRHLDEAYLALAQMRANAQATADIDALRQRIQDQLAAAKIAALRQQMQETILTQNLTALYESIRDGRARHYVPMKNGLVGGMVWLLDFNAHTTDPQLIAQAHLNLQRQERLAGNAYSDAIDFQRYNFVLGIAKSTEAMHDLLGRVVLDEYRAGRFTTEQQTAYAFLADRAFEELGCHSNGAMICLDALRRHDVKAKHVVLYGPQITPESLHMWDDLVKTGQIASLEIRINQGDPVPPLAMTFGPSATTQDAPPLRGAQLFYSSVLAKVVRTLAPSATVLTYPCQRLPTIACHQMDSYKRNRP